MKTKRLLCLYICVISFFVGKALRAQCVTFDKSILHHTGYSSKNNRCTYIFTADFTPVSILGLVSLAAVEYTVGGQKVCVYSDKGETNVGLGTCNTLASLFSVFPSRRVKQSVTLELDCGIPDDFKAEPRMVSLLNCLSSNTASLDVTGNAEMSPRSFVTNSIATAPMSVKLHSFRGYQKSEGKGVELSWKVDDEKNFDRFVIMRGNGLNGFEPVGTIPGWGENEEFGNFNFIDFGAPKEANYYRLAMHNYDGSVEYSKAIAVKRLPQHKFVAFPNPSTHGYMELIGEIDDNDFVVHGMNGEAVPFELRKKKDGRHSLYLMGRKGTVLLRSGGQTSKVVFK